MKKTVVLLLSLLASSPIMAAITAEQLVNDAYADGSLIATASACGVTQAEISHFANLQEESAMGVAKQNQLIFDSENYNDYVTAGFESTMQLLASMAVGDANYEKNCAEINAKMAQKLALKPL